MTDLKKLLILATVLNHNTKERYTLAAVEFMLRIIIYYLFFLACSVHVQARYVVGLVHESVVRVGIRLGNRLVVVALLVLGDKFGDQALLAVRLAVRLLAGRLLSEEHVL